MDVEPPRDAIDAPCHYVPLSSGSLPGRGYVAISHLCSQHPTYPTWNRAREKKSAPTYPTLAPRCPEPWCEYWSMKILSVCVRAS